MNGYGWLWNGYGLPWDCYGVAMLKSDAACGMHAVIRESTVSWCTPAFGKGQFVANSGCGIRGMLQALGGGYVRLSGAARLGQMPTINTPSTHVNTTGDRKLKFSPAG